LFPSVPGGSIQFLDFAKMPADIRRSESRCDESTSTGVQLIINEVIGRTSPANNLDVDGVVNVVDAQIEINVALGFGCAAS
jgi:hypothetical protein